MPYRTSPRRRRSPGRSSWCPQDRSSLPPGGYSSELWTWGGGVTRWVCAQRGPGSRGRDALTVSATLAHARGTSRCPCAPYSCCTRLAGGLVCGATGPVLPVRRARHRCGRERAVRGARGQREGSTGPLARDRPAQPFLHLPRATSRPALPTSAPHAVPELGRRCPGTQPGRLEPRAPAASAHSPAHPPAPRPRPACSPCPPGPPHAARLQAGRGSQGSPETRRAAGHRSGQRNTHSRPRGCGSSSPHRCWSGRRGRRRPAGWHTPGPTRAQSSCRTRRPRSSAWGAPRHGTGQTSCGGGAGHARAGPPRPPTASTRRPSRSRARLTSPQNRRTREDSVQGATARPRGRGAGLGGGGQLRVPGPPPATPAEGPPDSTRTALGTRPSLAWPLALGFLPGPGPERPAWPLAAALPAACSSASPTETGEIGRSEKARGHVTRQLSPVDVRTTGPGPSAT